MFRYVIRILITRYVARGVALSKLKIEKIPLSLAADFSPIQVTQKVRTRYLQIIINRPSLSRPIKLVYLGEHSISRPTPRSDGFH